MSLSTSKSKTQLAYASTYLLINFIGSGKAVNKPKGKNASTLQTNQLAKGKHPARNSTGNIYESIMGQIEPKQQDYIKSLIVKNERQSLKNDKQSELYSKEQGLKSEPAINNAKSASTKQGKQEPSKKSALGSHEKTRSQAQLIAKQVTDMCSSVETTKSIIRCTGQKVPTESSCLQNNSLVQIQPANKVPQLKSVNTTTNSKEILFKVKQSEAGDYSLQKADKSQIINKATPKNPIIQALNNTSSSFAKKLQVFELEYPTDEREERSTHKKTGSKLVQGEYFSCQTSPKNMAKTTYAKQVVITTKPHINYNTSKAQPISSNISPISSAKNSNQKNPKKVLQIQTAPSTNFISCLDEYLQALTVNATQTNQFQENNRASHGNNGNMKRSNSSKLKEFPASKGQPFTLGKQSEEEETIVLENGVYHTKNHNKVQLNGAKPLSIGQQQKLLKQLSMEKKKIEELNSIIQIFHQQLSKLKKKEKKMKQNQYHMIEVMKELNQQLTEERNQRRRLEGVVKDFQNKIRGISRGKDRNRRESMDVEQRPERKTIYGAPSLSNNMHFNTNKSNSRLEKQFKKHSNNNNNNSRYSSMMLNNYQQDREEPEFESYYQKQSGDEGFFKNKTQKFSKIISNFELENHPDDEQEIFLRHKNYNPHNNANINNAQQVKMVRDSLKNVGYLQPSSCKNSNYLNSSLPSKPGKSRPMTPKLVEQLFKSTKQSQHHSNFQSQSSEDDQVCYNNQPQLYQDHQHNFTHGNDFESEQESRPSQMSQNQYQQPHERYYYQQEVVKRIR